MRCIALRHVAFEDLGTFEGVLKRRGYEIAYRQAGLDNVTEEEWLAREPMVILGGPIGVYEDDKYPWLRDEIAAVRQRLEKSLPTLGICLGAQLMAAALGAKVYPGKAKEIGWGTVSLSDAGEGSCLLALRGAPVLHWHGDTFDLPVGAQLLASTPIAPHQAFAVGKAALALQFHPEADGRRIETWLIGHTCELQHAGIQVGPLRAESFRVANAARQAGTEMLERWLSEIETHE